MIDFHNHILPGADDGSESIDMSLDMLRKAAKQGITEVINTVHFQHPKMDDKNVEYKYLLNEVNKLQEALDKENINIKIHLSSEVFFLQNLSKMVDNPLLTIGNGKYMLVEFSVNIVPFGYEEEFYELQLKGVTPIIAHPERYRFVQKKVDILKKWIDTGYIIQVDAGSIRGDFGEKIKNITMEMVDKGYVHLIGSDAHNNKNRNFCLKKTYDILENRQSIDYVNVLKSNSIRLLKGENLNTVKNYSEKIRSPKKITFTTRIKNIFKI